jgi:hypothetical protein
MRYSSVKFPNSQCDDYNNVARRAAGSIKPGVTQSETQGRKAPRISQPSKRPATLFIIRGLAAASRARLHLLSADPGYASLHPRLYAAARSAGYYKSTALQFES